MDTKLKGDIAEQVAILEGLQRGWGVLKPIGIDYFLDRVCSRQALRHHQACEDRQHHKDKH